MKRLVVLALVILLSDPALADDARQLRLEAGALIQAAEAADTARKRKKLLEQARSKLLEVRERYPSESTRLTLYIGGKRVTLTAEDLESRIAAAPLADLDVGKLREVLGRSLSPTAVDENGWTDLHWAAVLNLPELAVGLLEAGADVSAQIRSDQNPVSDSLKRSLNAFGFDTELFWKTGGTPLHYAAGWNAYEVAGLLIERGADIRAENNKGSTPLHFVGHGNASKAAALLIERGAEVNAKNNEGSTPLHFVGYGNTSKAAALLIERGADVNTKDNKGRTPLHLVAVRNASKAAALLIERGADIHAKDGNDRTPLHFAAWGNATKVAALLIESGAGMHVKGNAGKTPIAVAAENSAHEVSMLLKKRQTALEDRLASVEIGKLRDVLGRTPSPVAVDENGWTDLHWAAALNLPELAEALIAVGVPVDARLTFVRDYAIGDLQGRLYSLLGHNLKLGGSETPLHIAAGENSLAVANVLIARGADTKLGNWSNGEGWTPIDIAIKTDAIDVVKSLLNSYDANEFEKKRNDFLFSAATGATKVAAFLVEKGADVNATDEDGWTPLHMATYHGYNDEISLLLISLEANVNAKDNYGWTPLLRAHYSEAGREKVVAALLDAGAHIHAKTSDGRSSFDLAKGGELAILKRHQESLLSHLSSLDSSKLGLYRALSPTKVNDSGITDLHLASLRNNQEIAKALLLAGADVGARDQHGNTPLHAAAENDARDVAIELISVGADIDKKNKDGFTPLHDAAQMNAKDIARVLIDMGADVHSKDGSGSTPLHFAVQNNTKEVAVLLLAAGADIHAKDNGGRTPLHKTTYTDAFKAAAMLVEYGADIHVKDSEGWTTLHLAASFNAPNVLAVLAESGADLHSTVHGWQPLHTAAWQNAREAAGALIDRGANIAALKRLGPFDTRTSLHIAAERDAAAVAALLIDRGANVDSSIERNLLSDGWTPLHIAAENNAQEVAKLLIERGADMHARHSRRAQGGNGTPLHVAAENNSQMVAEVLIEAGADIHLEDNERRTPLEVARRMGSQEVQASLERAK